LNISSPIEPSHGNVLLYNDPIIINVPSLKNNKEVEVENFCEEVDLQLYDIKDLGSLNLEFEDIEELTSAGCSASQNYEINDNIDLPTSSERKKKYANVNPFKKCLLWPKTPPKKCWVNSTKTVSRSK
jgi:hypothetical protein